MKIMLTGGTGFVGSHVARQLLAAGHELRLLVRDRARAVAVLAAADGAGEGAGPGALEFVEGDLTDSAAVRRVVSGCEGAVHAAAATPLGHSSPQSLAAVNVGGVRNVVDAALAEGVERIVCVSSITAIFNVDGNKVHADSPPAPSRLPYGQSKVEAEYYLRSLQAQGAPVAIVYPGGVIGPDDPGFSASCRALQHRIENGFRLFDDGGIQHVDVRDLAAFLGALVTAGEPGRFLLPGVYLRWTELADLLEEVSGCELRRIPARGWKLRLLGRAFDLLRKFRPLDSPVSAETMRYATLWPKIANTAALQDYGLALRHPRETFADTLAWMVAAGHLEPARCPRVSPAPGTTAGIAV